MWCCALCHLIKGKLELCLFPHLEFGELKIMIENEDLKMPFLDSQELGFQVGKNSTLLRMIRRFNCTNFFVLSLLAIS